jgi:signal peptidase II
MATTTQSTPHNTGRIVGWINKRWMWLRELPKALLAHQTILLVTAVVAIVIDQATKWWVEANMVLYSRIAPIESVAHLFDFLHVKNPGAAFGTGQEYGWVFTLIAFGVCGFILFYNSVILGQHPAFRFALGLIMGGALGNVIDRFRIGEVTDFIHFDFTPLASDRLVEMIPLLNFAIFNMADTFIFSGVCVMFWLILKDKLPDDPWTEAEPSEELQTQQPHADRETPSAASLTQSLRSTKSTVPSNYPMWEADDDQEESRSDARFGLKVSLILGLGGFLAILLLIRRQRNKR